jgi:hypothetical protein
MHDIGPSQHGVLSCRFLKQAAPAGRRAQSSGLGRRKFERSFFLKKEKDNGTVNKSLEPSPIKRRKMLVSVFFHDSDGPTKNIACRRGNPEVVCRLCFALSPPAFFDDPPFF